MTIQTTLKSIFIASVINLGIFTPVNAKEWVLTPQTYVGFDVRSIGMSIVKGRFEQVQSSMNFDAVAPQNASAQFVMEVNSLSLSMPSLRNMILGEDLFYADQYPTATFSSHEFITLGNDQYQIKGSLTLRGITRPVVLATLLKPHPGNSKLMDVEAKTVVQRSDFGMKKAFAGIGEKVNIEVYGQWQMK